MSAPPSPNSDELKKCLKDAGIYEEYMTHDDMLTYYQAIKSSESTAQQEAKKRHVEEDVPKTNGTKAKPAAVDSIYDFDGSDGYEEDAVSDNSPPEIKTSPKREKILQLKTPQKSAQKPLKSVTCYEKIDTYDPFDCPPLKHKPLDVIFYDRKYEEPPHCNPKYAKLTVLERAEIIRDFHRAISQRFYKFQCSSGNLLPFVTVKNDPDILEDIESTVNNEEHDETKEIYTSRSGRQTKRKIYTDTRDDDADLKKTKKDQNKSCELEKKPVSKRQGGHKLSNQEIMKRSKLFSDTKSTPTRTERLFDMLKKGGKSEVSSEEAHDVDNTEKVENENDEDVIYNSQSSDELEFKPKELAFIPRRVPPPLRGRRAIGSKKQADSEVRSKSANPRTPSTSTNTPKSHTPEPQQDTKTNCPICSKIFDLEEIEAHASSCGLIMETESFLDTLPPSDNAKKVKCNICDKEMLMNKDYEVHVNKCIAKVNCSDRASP